MKKKDLLLSDFHSESIDNQMVTGINGGAAQTPTRNDHVGSNDTHTGGDSGDCDVDKVIITWFCDD